MSFLSPCILPLVPGYLGFVSGLTDPAQPRNRCRGLAGVGLFVLGLAAVVTLYGAAFGVIGSWLHGGGRDRGGMRCRRRTPMTFECSSADHS